MNNRQDNNDSIYEKVYRHLVKKAGCRYFDVNFMDHLVANYNMLVDRTIGVECKHGFMQCIPVDSHQESIIMSDNRQDGHKMVVGLLLDAAKDGDVRVLGTGITFLKKGSTLESIGIEIDLEG